jgi:hypothetical protein
MSGFATPAEPREPDVMQHVCQTCGAWWLDEGPDCPACTGTAVE